MLWHKVSEKEKKEIEKKAKSIMDSFSKKLDKLGKSKIFTSSKQSKDSSTKGKIGDSSVERDEFERSEEDGDSLEIDRKIMFDNASNKNKDFIIAEKGKW
tara:strand:+ start:4918 stop:5217 length:300 start_codon:yes stop_codon:yes gene_type:complete